MYNHSKAIIIVGVYQKLIEEQRRVDYKNKVLTIKAVNNLIL